MGFKLKAGTKGNAVNYTTRNQALKRLQLKLSQFRRLCILKGIHPREPKKKRQGQNKTYYHVKDINFLLHEPLLDKFREIRAYDKKVTKAKAKRNNDLAKRLAERRPGYRLDHLVRERYPSFTDALRDLDDPLTLVHLFAVLPAEKALHIPRKLVDTARRLSLEFQAYVTKTHALRKTFVSVKGIYYQAEICGQTVTWITPHALSQHLPEDVDYRVMVTFLEFYETMLEFINFKLYHSLGLAYPPRLSSAGDSAATGLMAVMHDVATGAGGLGLISAAPTEADPQSESAVASERRLGSLAEKLTQLKEHGDGKAGPTALMSDAEMDRTLAEAEAELARGEESDAEDAEVSALMPTPAAAAARTEDDEACGALFKGLTFFLPREVNRESLVFLIKAFGGEAGWAGPESPIDENDEAITHHVCDRPAQKHRFLSVAYVQPQWVYDCVNFRLLIPTEAYVPGIKPPPHVSPFVNDDEEGYVPDYALKLKELQAAARGESTAGAEQEAGTSRSYAMEEQEEDERADERAYQQELAAELAGVPFSQSKQRRGQADDDDSEPDEPSDEEGPTSMPERLSKQALKDSVTKRTMEKADGALLLDAMLPRKRKTLYEATQIGKARKQADVDEILARKQLLAAKQASEAKGGSKEEAKGSKATTPKRKKLKKST